MPTQDNPAQNGRRYNNSTTSTPRSTANSPATARSTTKAGSRERSTRRPGSTNRAGRHRTARPGVGIDLGTPVFEAIGAEAMSPFTGRIPAPVVAIRRSTQRSRDRCADGHRSRPPTAGGRGGATLPCGGEARRRDVQPRPRVSLPLVQARPTQWTGTSRHGRRGPRAVHRRLQVCVTVDQGIPVARRRVDAARPRVLNSSSRIERSGTCNRPIGRCPGPVLQVCCNPGPTPRRGVSSRRPRTESVVGVACAERAARGMDRQRRADAARSGCRGVRSTPALHRDGVARSWRTAPELPGRATGAARDGTIAPVPRPGAALEAMDLPMPDRDPRTDHRHSRAAAPRRLRAP
jgi:hypothetical protein